MKIDPGSTTPLFLQIVHELQSLIASGAFLEGERVPSARELSTELKVNPSTVQKAFTELEQQGLIENRRGIGKFVTGKGAASAIKQSETVVKEMLRNAISFGRSSSFSDKQILNMLQQELKSKHRRATA